MKNIIKSAAIAALAAAAFAGPAAATIVYQESVSGDFSNSGAAPTPLAFALGANEVYGSSGNVGGVDRDYFTFSILPGFALTAISVLPGTTSIGNGTLSFIGLETGNTFDTSPTSMSAAGMLGWTHYSPAQIGTDILDDMNTTMGGSSGFTAPLGAGDYSVWIQETAAGTANYGFNFAVAQVPEPETWALMLVGFGILGGAMRRRPGRLPLTA